MMSNTELQRNYIQVEDLVRNMVLWGEDNLFDIVKEVNNKFKPVTDYEQEMYSEAIINARSSILN